MKRLTCAVPHKTEDSSALAKEIQQCTETLRSKISATMQTLLSLVPSQASPSPEAPSQKLAFRWQEDTQTLFWKIMSTLDRWVHADNELRKKEKGKELLHAREERKKKAEELVSFWPSPEWMTVSKLLRYYRSLKKGKDDNKKGTMDKERHPKNQAKNKGSELDNEDKRVASDAGKEKNTPTDTAKATLIFLE